MKSAFFNRFFVAYTLGCVLILLLQIFVLEVVDSVDLRYSMFGPVCCIVLLILGSVCVAANSATVDGMTEKHTKMLRGSFGVLLLLALLFMWMEMMYIFALIGVSILILVAMYVYWKQSSPRWSSDNGIGFCFFYLSVVAILVLTLFNYIQVDDLGDRYESRLLPRVLIFYSVFVFSFSILFFGVIYYWKRSKAVSVVLLGGVFALLCNLYCEIYSFESLYTHTYAGNIRHYNYETAYEVAPSEVEDQDQVYEPEDSLFVDNVDILEEEEKEVEPFTLDFLWNHPQADSDSVYAAIRYCDRDLIGDAHGVLNTYLDYYAKEKYTDKDKANRQWRMQGERAHSIIMSYLGGNRNNLNLRGMFKAYKPLMQQLISQEKYNKKYRRTVELLLIAYYDVEYKSSFQEMYDFLATDGDTGYDQHLSYLSQYVSREGFRTFVIDYDCGSKNIFDYYSFWARRANEGNMEACVEILEEIQRIYDDEGDDQSEY